MKKHAAPLIAAVLLLLPVLYVVSYFTLVVPSGVWEVIPGQEGDIAALQGYYRLEGIDDFYWPLEHFDRRLRPAAWSHGPYPSSPVVDPSA